MRDAGERQRHRQREKQAPCREPNVGLDPGSPGSCPVLKADSQLTEPPRHPRNNFCKILFIHRDTEREGQRHREKQALCREPDVGLDPGSPGSQPELKADAQPLSHPGVPH